MIGRQTGAFYTISSLLLTGKSSFCYVINAICYAIGRLKRECYLPAQFNSVLTKALLVSYCSLPLKNQLLRRAGIQARALIYFYVLFTRAAIQTGP